MRYRSILAFVPLLLGSLSVLSCGSSGTTAPPTGICADLTSYTATATTAPSFMTDVYPILSNTGSATATTSGCATTFICHGTPAQPLNSTGAPVTLSFVDSPAAVKAALLGASVNAPSMKRVVAGDVGASFMAYKISGQDALACSNLTCVSGASVGGHKPCGDAMPTMGTGTLTAAERTTILDWIAKGAAD